MTSEKRRCYPRNWESLALACKERAAWRCEHCGIKQLAIVTSRAGRPYTIYLHAAHRDHDKANPNPTLLCLCVSCHARYDYRQATREQRIRIQQIGHRREIARIGSLFLAAYTWLNQQRECAR